MCVRVSVKFAPDVPKMRSMTSRRRAGSRCASTKADDSVNDVPIPSITWRALSGKTETTVPRAGPLSNATFARGAIRSPPSDVVRISNVVVGPGSPLAIAACRPAAARPRTRR